MTYKTHIQTVHNKVHSLTPIYIATAILFITVVCWLCVNIITKYLHEK